ncbi:amidase [Psychromicrobium silvestre]|uniref:Amidase n=1 Tax=Psychromicrobium silvestre TaxID=1645614 RepID=A0A7Y9S688_9MICC|nr:amidase family protein [Psychromicrobium silvestre]NYE94476.1 amidase [Psychromicrobium silvestre]
MKDLLSGSALGAARAIRESKISSRELTEAQLERIEAINPKINALVEVHREEALAAAEQADRLLASGAELGALHGVPISIKEAFQVKGFHSSWGNPVFKDAVLDRDATVVSRLRDAGAIVLGTSNVAFMLGDFGQSSNEVYGRTNNPWDLERAPGGSSGGAAASVAAGLSFLDYGSDLAGSVRIPASFCGVYGLKPSVGIVPATGFQPPVPQALPSDHVYQSAHGPIARSPQDLRAALALTAGPEAPTSKAYRWALPPSRHRELKEFRISVVLDHPAAPVSSEIGGLLSNAVDLLAAAGVSIHQGWPEGYDPERGAESFSFQLGMFFAFQGEPDDTSLAQLVEQENRRMAARSQWQRHFEGCDVFLSPSNFTAAFPHDERSFGERTVWTPEGEQPYAAQPFWIAPASLTGLPALSAPIGRTARGLPVGAQIVGPLYEDDTAISFAELAAEVLGGFEAPPE